MKIFQKITRNITVFYLKGSLKRSFRSGRISTVIDLLKECLEEKNAKKAIILYVQALVLLERYSWEFHSLSRVKGREKTIFYQKLGELLTSHLDLKNNNRLIFIGQPIFLGGQNIEEGTFVYSEKYFRNSFNETEELHHFSRISKLDDNLKTDNGDLVNESWNFMKKSIEKFYKKLVEIDEILNPSQIEKIKGMEAYDPLPLR